MPDACSATRETDTNPTVAAPNVATRSCFDTCHTKLREPTFETEDTAMPVALNMYLQTYVRRHLNHKERRHCTDWKFEPYFHADAREQLAETFEWIARGDVRQRIACRIASYTDFLALSFKKVAECASETSSPETKSWIRDIGHATPTEEGHINKEITFI